MAIGDAFRLDDRRALVTGASRGLGAAIARGLAEAGADVVLHSSRDPAQAAAETLVADAIAALGRIDVLVNNAGVIRRAPAAQFGDGEWDEVLQVNLSAVFRLSRAAAAGMLERGSGKIINIASLLSFQGGIRVPAYAAAKGGVAQLTKALANEWAPLGVNVNAIAPGYMVTDNTKPLMEDPVRFRDITARIPAGRWGQPEDLAGAAVFLASRASDYVHGHVLVVDGGWMGR